MTRIGCNGIGQRFIDELWPQTNVIEPAAVSVGHFIDSAEFMRRDCRLNWLVQEILVDGQPAVMGGAKKTLKTSTLLDLAVSMATGNRFLHRFAVTNPIRVGIISGESGEAVLKETFRRVCEAKRISDLEGMNIWWSFTLPHLSFQKDLDALGDAIRANELKVIILDPLYLSLLAGNSKLSASNLYDIGPLLASATAVCRSAGATPIFAHHTRMGAANSYEPPDLGDLAFAGVQEYARQWLLIGRREKYDPGTGMHKLWLNVGGSAGQSGCWALDIGEGLMQADFTGRQWAVRVRSVGEEIARVNAHRESERQDRERTKDQAGREKIRGVLRHHPKGETKNQIKLLAGIGSKVERLIAVMLGDGEIEAVTVMKPAGRRGLRPQPGYRLVEQSVEESPEDRESQKVTT